jgi:hypothetical protein
MAEWINFIHAPREDFAVTTGGHPLRRWVCAGGELGVGDGHYVRPLIERGGPH